MSKGCTLGRPHTSLTAPSQIAAVVADLKLPAMYSWRQYSDAGGLMSYGSNLPDLYRLGGSLMSSRILKGDKPRRPADRTADQLRAGRQSQDRKGDLGCVPDSVLLLAADEVIE